MMVEFSRRSLRSRKWCAQINAAACAALFALVPHQPVAAESLREALAAAYHSNPKLDAERAKLRATDEDVARAESGYRPIVEGSAEIGHQRASSEPRSATAGESNPWGYTLSIRQPVFQGYRTQNGVAEAEATVKAGRENLRLVESTVLLEAVRAYMDVVTAASIVRIRNANVSVLAQELDAANTRRSVKEVTKTDVAQAQARHARAVASADLAKADLKSAAADYERVIGHAPGGTGMPPMKLKFLPRSLEEAWGIAERQSPNLASALYREEAARFAVDKVRGELLPEVNVEASYGHRENPNSAFDQQDSASISGRVSVPLYDGGEIRARVRQAKHTQVSRVQEIEQARTETVAQVTSAWSALSGQRAKLKSDAIQVDANRIALEGTREEEKVGQRTLLDVLNAEQEYLDAQIEHANSRREVVVAGYQLLAAMGSLTAEDILLTSTIYDPEQHLLEARENWFGIDITGADGRRQAFQADDRDVDVTDIVE